MVVGWFLQSSMRGKGAKKCVSNKRDVDRSKERGGGYLTREEKSKTMHFTMFF